MPSVTNEALRNMQFVRSSRGSATNVNANYYMEKKRKDNLALGY